MTATLKIVRIGNSRGIRLPQEFIRHCGLGDEVVVETSKRGLLLRLVLAGRLSLADSFKAMALDCAAKDEAREWAESGLADGLGGE
jgi:antitoxin component of MazEF toxin-antitoxin module